MYSDVTKQVSVVIPLIEFTEYLDETTRVLLRTPGVREIIVLPNQRPAQLSTLYRNKKIRIIPTIRSEPGFKRNVGSRKASSSIIAFLDDDSYPAEDWLAAALRYFRLPEIAAVGGPAITPSSDSFFQKLSGAVFETYLGGATARIRYLPVGVPRPVDDWPTVNLLVRRRAFLKVGGFNEQFWPGEDTKLCLDLVKAGHEIYYEPKAVVFHHRRSNLTKHFRQVFQYAFYRGNFFKIYPETSRRLAYTFPSLFLFYLVFTAVDYRLQITDYSWLHWPLWVYSVLLALDGLLITRERKDPFLGLWVIPVIVATHVSYGTGFIKGLVLPQPKQIAKEY